MSWLLLPAPFPWGSPSKAATPGVGVERVEGGTLAPGALTCQLASRTFPTAFKSQAVSPLLPSPWKELGLWHLPGLSSGPSSAPACVPLACVFSEPVSAPVGPAWR